MDNNAAQASSEAWKLSPYSCFHSVEQDFGIMNIAHRGCSNFISTDKSKRGNKDFFCCCSKLQSVSVLPEKE